jgi:hypothetical protein
MRKIIPCTLLVLFLSFGSAEGLAQEKFYITVEGNKLNNGVVLVDILKAGKTYVLQCNQGAPGCAALNNGKYQMVELPEDCRYVRVQRSRYRGASALGRRLGHTG